MTEDSNLFGEPLARVGAPLFRERWSNQRAFWIGVYTGQGLTAQRVCDRLNDGAQPNMITAMTSFWGYQSKETDHTYAPVRIALSGIHRTKIDAEAERRGMDISEISRAVMETVAREELWKAVLDG
ncbi:MAG: hypothetical protein ACOH2M_03260 [Cypionkella sp.]